MLFVSGFPAQLKRKVAVQHSLHKPICKHLHVTQLHTLECRTAQAEANQAVEVSQAICHGILREKCYINIHSGWCALNASRGTVFAISEEVFHCSVMCRELPHR